MRPSVERLLGSRPLAERACASWGRALRSEVGGAEGGRRAAAVPAQAQKRAGWSRGSRRGTGDDDDRGRSFRPLTSGPGAAADGVAAPLGPLRSAPSRPAAARPPFPHATPRRSLRPLRPGTGPRRCPARGASATTAAPWRWGPRSRRRRRHRGATSAASATQRYGRRFGRSGPRRRPHSAAARGRCQDGAREQVPARADGREGQPRPVLHARHAAPHSRYRGLGRAGPPGRTPPHHHHHHHPSPVLGGAGRVGGSS